LNAGKEPRRTCILVEFTDGSFRAYDYPDEDSAVRSYDECRGEWNAGRNLVVYLRPRGFSSSGVHRGDEVAHLELTTPDDAKGRGVECQQAVIFG
jgi:hypothetical protein